MKKHSAIFFAFISLTYVLAAEFPEPYDTEPDQKTPRLSPKEAAEQFKVPEGFHVSLFAGEPDIRNPIGMTWDSRGRLWVAENFTYAERAKKYDRALRDRVLIFEDTDGDGHFDKRTVFYDQLQILTSIEVGYGGVWLMCSPNLLFIPDADRDGVPDGPPQVMLDGFGIGVDNYHTLANGLRWGPDGWLYGRCGASSPGKLGVPGTPTEKRVPLNGGIWRFNPHSKIVEVLTHGTTNPWGVDWDEFGEPFFTNTVNGHFWHLIPGAHFARSHSIDPNPYAYTLMEQHADHQHFAGALKEIGAETLSLGGGHAPCGLMLYQGDNWPTKYHNQIFTLNLHGRRINNDQLERKGSGYVATHRPDLAFSSDLWFRGLDLSCGPDGGVFMLDWNDIGECHENNGVQRSTGRIFKMFYGTPKRAVEGDLAKMSDVELVKLHEQTNDWYCRMARLLLNERHRSGANVDAAITELRKLFRSTNEVTRVRAYCTLNLLGGIDFEKQLELLRDPSENVRVWAIRSLTDDQPLDTVLGQRHPFAPPGIGPEIVSAFTRAAKDDPSSRVRLMLASALQRLPFINRVFIADPILAHSEDAADHNIPLMMWYALMPLANSSPQTLATLGARCRLPKTCQLIARRLSESIRQNPGALDALLEAAASDEKALTRDILTGMSEGLKGIRKAPKPAAWDKFVEKIGNTADKEIADRVRELSSLFGDGRSLDEVKTLALDDKADLATRRSALQTLIESRPPELREICEKLLTTTFLNATAAKGLVLFDDAAVAVKIAKVYSRFHPNDRPAVVEALASRPTFAGALLDEIAGGKIPRNDVSPFFARQILSFNDAALSKRLSEVWGQLRDADDEKKKLIADLKSRLTPEVRAAGDKSRGRLQFKTICASCHTLYGEGGHIGPDLTGANRDNIDYLLDNIVDPSAVIDASFRMSIVALNDGRILNGIITSRTEQILKVQTPTELLTLEMSDVKKIRESTQSMMPEGLLQTFSAEQLRDLFAYLMNPTQVPLPDEAGKTQKQ